MTLEESQNRVVELFVALAGDPDDEATAQAADEALRRLDALLAQEERAAPEA